jgi:hypothetical protein
MRRGTGDGAAGSTAAGRGAGAGPSPRRPAAPARPGRLALHAGAAPLRSLHRGTRRLPRLRAGARRGAGPGSGPGAARPADGDPARGRRAQLLAGRGAGGPGRDRDDAAVAPPRPHRLAGDSAGGTRGDDGATRVLAGGDVCWLAPLAPADRPGRDRQDPAGRGDGPPTPGPLRSDRMDRLPAGRERALMVAAARASASSATTRTRPSASRSSRTRMPPGSSSTSE